MVCTSDYKYLDGEDKIFALIRCAMLMSVMRLRTSQLFNTPNMAQFCIPWRECRDRETVWLADVV